jgi:hypothetical protein
MSLTSIEKQRKMSNVNVLVNEKYLLNQIKYNRKTYVFARSKPRRTCALTSAGCGGLTPVNNGFTVCI